MTQQNEQALESGGVPAWYERARGFTGDVARRGVFFVLGCQKSGTSWIESLARAHPELALRAEGHFLSVLGPCVEHAINTYNKLDKTNLKLSAEDCLSAVRFLIDQQLARTLAEAAEPDRVTLIGDKTPEHAMMIPQLAMLYPGAKFVHVIRDGRDCAVSGWAHLHRLGHQRKFRSFADYAAFFAEGHWVSYIRLAQQAGREHPGSYIEMRYEVMQDDPVGEARRLFEFLGVAHDEASVRAASEAASFKNVSGRSQGTEDVRSHYRKGIVGEWRERFDPEATQRFQAIAGGLLRELGYAA